MRGGQGLRHVRRVVGRPVIDNHDLDRPVGLRQHAVNGLGQQHRAVVDGNHRRHQAGPHRRHRR